jgi:hypothetical protein
MFYLGQRLPAGDSSKITVEVNGGSLQLAVITWLCAGNSSYITASSSGWLHVCIFGAKPVRML